MQDYQREFIEYAIECGVLRFGDFTLKSGRKSPYFFNFGLFNTGARLARVGEFYAKAYLQLGLQADVLYGPAYKGIPLVCTTSIALSKLTGDEIPFVFNRKEAKTHGEGGSLIGSELKGSALILDDVITAGTSVRESLDIIHEAQAEPCGVLIALDRQEKGQGDLSAIQEIKQNFNLKVDSIVTLSDIILYLQTADKPDALQAIQAYRASYGIAG